MSDQPPRDDEPTRAYSPFGEDAGEPTRMDTPVPPYDASPPFEPPSNPYAPGQREPEPEKDKREWLAPVITVGLIAILLGVGLGWLLFRNSSSTNDEPPTTTTSITTSTTALPTVVATTSTTSGNTTTTAANTTTTTATRSSSTVRATTTTAKPATSTSTAPTTTNPGNIVVGTTQP